MARHLRIHKIALVYQQAIWQADQCRPGRENFDILAKVTDKVLLNAEKTR